MSVYIYIVNVIIILLSFSKWGNAKEEKVILRNINNMGKAGEQEIKQKI